jgi:O-antigen ligase
MTAAGAAAARASVGASRALPAIALGLVAVSLGTGLLFFPQTFVFPYVTPKVLFLRGVAVLLAGLLFLTAPRLAVRPTLITVTVAAFLLSATLSTLTSIDSHRSFWDTQERMLGLFTLWHYGVFYLAATSLVRDRSSWLLLLRVFLAASALIIGVGIAQKIWPQFLYHQGGVRVSSTLGHPIYLGGLAATTVFVGALRYGLGGRAKRVEAMLAILLGVVGVGISGSRSSVLALAGGVCVLGAGYFLVLPRRSRARWVLGSLVLLVIGAGTAVFVLRQSAGFAAVPALGRFAGVTLGSSSVRTRILAWDIALDAFMERPLLGWGPANYYYAFNRHYRPEILEFGWGETWFDSAHNAPLDALVQQGLLGGLTYVALLVMPPILLWRAYYRGQLPHDLPCAATALLAAHFIQGLFVFEDPTSYLCLAFLLAYFNRTLDGFEHLPAVSWNRSRVLAAMAVTAAAAWGIWTTDLEPARANQLARAAILAAQDSHPQRVRTAFDRYRAFGSPYVDSVRELLAVAVIQRLNRPEDPPRSPAYGELARFTYAEMGQARERHPHDVRLALHRARLALLLATNFNDHRFLAATETELETAFASSPRRQEIRFLLSSTKVLLGKPQEAIRLLETAIGAAPRVAEGWWRLALVYRATGQTSQARQVLKDARARGIRFEPSEERWVRELLDESR